VNRVIKPTDPCSAASRAAVCKPDRSKGNPNLEAVGRLASAVAHDFNNLLTGIMLYCDLISDEVDHPSRRVPDRNRLRHAADEIHNACERGAALIQQLMAVARPGIGEPASVSWNEAILGMSNLLQRLLGADVELLTDLAIDLKTVDLSPTRAQQVILNLVLNARDAMPKGGKIVLQTRNHAVAAHHPSEFVGLSVTDTGCGMDERTLAQAFEPFFTTKPPGQGSGIGLATVRQIVSQAGGEIQIKTAPLCGTGVEVRLPPHSPAEMKPRKPKAPRGRAVRATRPPVGIGEAGVSPLASAKLAPRSSTSLRRRLS
jgi:signal transduction histidine kinase